MTKLVKTNIFILNLLLENVMTLSQSLEDYLEKTYKIIEKNKVARVKDLAAAMNVKKSSVVGALKKLEEMGFVKKERYGYVELTQKGIMAAREIFEKHRAILNFLTKVLGVSEKVAIKDACNFEHYISKETYERMTKFVEFLQNCECGTPVFLKNFETFLKEGKISYCIADEILSEKGKGKLFKLSDIKPGEKCVVKFVIKSPFRKKLLDLGIISGAEIGVEKVAPFKGPIYLRVKDYFLTLRQEEADTILVEKIGKVG